MISGILAGEIFKVSILQDRLSEQFLLFDQKQTVIKHNFEESFIHGIFYIAIIVIVLHEFLLYPVFYKCCPQIKSTQKFMIGVALQIARATALMVFEVLSRQAFIKKIGHNVTIQCVFYDNNSGLNAHLKSSVTWIAVASTLQSLSLLMLFTGSLEFLSAQVPYSMKGIMLGVSYGFVFISSAFGTVIILPFKRKLSVWGTGVISCGFWYAVLALIIELSTFILLVLLLRWYKKRKREDVLPNEHYYAERYYSKDT